MQHDVFFSIEQAPVDGHLPSEADMLRAFLTQVEAADQLGFGTAWVAEAHLSTEVQRHGPKPVVPHWRGEIGLNSHLPLLASRIFDRTSNLDVGAAVSNIVGLGGPLQAAERVASMLSWHGLDPAESRRLHMGFSAGRFDFVNRASGIVPRDRLEQVAWPALRSRVFREAAEIYVRVLHEDTLSSDDVTPTVLRREDVWVHVRCPACGAERDAPHALAHRPCSRCGADGVEVTEPLWEAIRAEAGTDEVRFAPRWSFERLAIVPRDWRRELLQLVVGSHDPGVQTHLNRFAPVQVFNLSITKDAVIEATHARMAKAYHPNGGPWQRGFMPRTTFVFLDATVEAARARAERTLGAYWSAMDGTLDPAKVADSTDNALVGDADTVAQQARERFHPDDRLMLWFDFFDHDTDRVVDGMRRWMEDVAPKLPS